MRRLVLLAALLLVAACGGPTRSLPNGSPVAVVDTACAERLKPLYDAERDLDSRLNVGLAQAAYSDKLGDVRVAYDAIVREGPLEGACFDNGKKLQDALNEYVAANTRWTQCISDVNCTVKTDALPEMQTHWSKATKLLDEVAVALPG